jgi:hypothetical protein
VKGAVTFRFNCDNEGQALAYWKAMVEASRPATCVDVRDIVIQLRNDDRPLENVEP